MKHSPVFVFDLDGVITDPSDSSVDREAVRHLYDLLQDGRFVAVNTGRSFEWVEANLLQVLVALGGPKGSDRLFIVCEKGGESIAWANGVYAPHPSRFALSDEIRQTAYQLYQDNQDSLGTMFWDATKKTMATIEKRPEADLEAFRVEQQWLVARLREAFVGYDVRVDSTTIAVDMESSQAGKHAGAELIYESAVAYYGVHPEMFVSFGDSKSDYEMARYFAQQGAGSTFVFVGDKAEVFDEEAGVHLVRTESRYAAGTCEYFAGKQHSY